MDEGRPGGVGQSLPGACGDLVRCGEGDTADVADDGERQSRADVCGRKAQLGGRLMARTLTPRDIFAFRNVNDPRIAPDGSRIVAAVSRRDGAIDERIPRLTLCTDRKTWT